MLPVVREGQHGPLLLMLHWLGGGAQTWAEVSRGLAARGVRCAAVDLPGFGEAASVAGYSVAEMADEVVETVRGLRAEADCVPWLIAGHSMGGTVAAVVARRALDGEAGLEGLRGILLVSSSPPGPEPMTDEKRQQMLESIGESTGDERKDHQRAAKLVDENTGKLPLPAAVRERAIEGVLRISRQAIRQWLEHGSKEDWAEQVGKLDVPALVFAGTEDSALGPAAQREHTLPHLPQGELIVLKNAGHLGPLERPRVLVEHITEFLAELDLGPSDRQVGLSSKWAELLDSDRVSPQTRAVMERRLSVAPDWSYRPKCMEAEQFRTLRAVVGRVVPSAGFDLAARLDEQLAEAKLDGWRFAMLPPDREAWVKGLRSFDLAAERVHGVPFVALFPDQQDELLQQAAAGKLGRGVLGALHLGDGSEAYTAEQMKSWSEDLRAEATRHYVGDPRTMERMGYTGFADDFGFTQIQLGQREELAQ